MLRQPLLARLAGQFFRSDDQILEDGLNRAFMDYFDCPRDFDPLRGHLEQFLGLIAFRKVANLVRGMQRRQQREQQWERGGEEDVSCDVLLEINPVGEYSRGRSPVRLLVE